METSRGVLEASGLGDRYLVWYVGIWGGGLGIREGFEWFLGIKKGFESTLGVFLGIWGGVREFVPSGRGI